MPPTTLSSIAAAVLFIADATSEAVSIMLPGIDVVVAFVKYCEAALGALLE